MKLRNMAVLLCAAIVCGCSFTPGYVERTDVQEVLRGVTASDVVDLRIGRQKLGALLPEPPADAFLSVNPRTPEGQALVAALYKAQQRQIKISNRDFLDITYQDSGQLKHTRIRFCFERSEASMGPEFDTALRRILAGHPWSIELAVEQGRD